MNLIIGREDIKVEKKCKDKGSSRGEEGSNYYFLNIMWVLMLQNRISHAGHKFNTATPVVFTHPEIILIKPDHNTVRKED